MALEKGKAAFFHSHNVLLAKYRAERNSSGNKPKVGTKNNKYNNINYYIVVMLVKYNSIYSNIKLNLLKQIPAELIFFFGHTDLIGIAQITP